MYTINNKNLIKAYTESVKPFHGHDFYNAKETDTNDELTAEEAKEMIADMTDEVTNAINKYLNDLKKNNMVGNIRISPSGHHTFMFEMPVSKKILQKYGESKIHDAFCKKMFKYDDIPSDTVEKPVTQNIKQIHQQNGWKEFNVTINSEHDGKILDIKVYCTPEKPSKVAKGLSADEVTKRHFKVKIKK